MGSALFDCGAVRRLIDLREQHILNVGHGDEVRHEIVAGTSAPRSGRGGRRFKSCHSGRTQILLPFRHRVAPPVETLVPPSVANLLWGAPRIHGELLKLGIDVDQTTVAKYM